MKISVRHADIEDRRDIFDWRNDLISRRYSHNSEKVDWDTHCRWFQEALANRYRILLICEDMTSGTKCAVVRFDIEKPTATVSINLSPDMRGRGLASPCLKSSAEYLAAHLGYLPTIRAEIKSVNRASIKAFEAAGYAYLRTVGDVLYYELDR